MLGPGWFDMEWGLFLVFLLIFPETSETGHGGFPENWVIWRGITHTQAPINSPQHKHWPTGPEHFSDRRASTGQYIVSFTGPAGPLS